MTDIKPTVQEKTAWAKVPQEFNDWWNGVYSDESNPFRFNSAAYWAWAGWSEAVRLNAQAVPEISTEHGPWVESNIHEGETYCKRCLVRSVFAGHKKCEPHIVSAPTAPQPEKPPLTDEQIDEIWQSRLIWSQRDFARAIEKAHGIGVKP